MHLYVYYNCCNLKLDEEAPFIYEPYSFYIQMICLVNNLTKADTSKRDGRANTSWCSFIWSSQISCHGQIEPTSKYISRISTNTVPRESTARPLKVNPPTQTGIIHQPFLKLKAIFSLIQYKCIYHKEINVWVLPVKKPGGASGTLEQITLRCYTVVVPWHTMFNPSPRADSHIAGSLIQFPVRSRAFLVVVADLLSSSMSLFSNLQMQWQ